MTNQASIGELLASLKEALVAEVCDLVLAQLEHKRVASGYIHGWAAASAYTGITESTLKRTDIPRFRVGDRVVFARSEIADWLEQFRERRA